MLPSVDVATYERILKNLAQTRVTIHCTITGQIAGRPGYLEEFLPFWTNRPEARKVWMSIFTPQQGATGPAILSPSVRVAVIAELLRLPPLYPILDMYESAIREFINPPRSPKTESSPVPLTLSPPISRTYRSLVVTH